METLTFLETQLLFKQREILSCGYFLGFENYLSREMTNGFLSLLPLIPVGLANINGFKMDARPHKNIKNVCVISSWERVLDPF